MNEPKHPHFVLADGMYCHVLPEQLVVGKKDIKEPYPEQNDRANVVVIVAVAIGALLCASFVTATFMTGLYVFTVLLLFIGIMASIALARLIQFSHTPYIRISDIVGVVYKKQPFGNDSFIVAYSGKGGRLLRRRYPIYDSEECLNQALRVMEEAGLLKPVARA